MSIFTPEHTGALRDQAEAQIISAINRNWPMIMDGLRHSHDETGGTGKVDVSIKFETTAFESTLGVDFSPLTYSRKVGGRDDDMEPVRIDTRQPLLFDGEGAE